MRLNAFRKSFRREVLVDSDGVQNSNSVVVLRSVEFGVGILGGLVLTVILAPISLFRPIEIWTLRSRRPKISLLIEDLEWGLRNLQLRSQCKKPKVIAFHFQTFPNRQLTKMYRRVLFLVGHRYSLVAKSLQFVWPIWGITKKNPIERYKEMFDTWNNAKSSIYFTKREANLGLKLERQLFGGDAPPFVCLAVQSRLYKELIDIPKTRFHGQLKDDPFTSISPIANYLPVIDFLTSRGIAVVRVGMLEDEKLPTDLGSLVSDYAVNNRSEFGDVWLHSRCLFSLTGGAGSHWFAAAFNRPAVLTDSYAIRSLYDAKSLFIPQSAWLEHESRYLKFAEIQNKEFGRDTELLKNGLTIIKNTSQEIVDVTAEMLSRLAGTWTDSEQDQELQRRYRNLVDGFPVHHRTPAKMGAKFLREHQHLLPD